jgi:hypothetical protein
VVSNLRKETVESGAQRPERLHVRHVGVGEGVALEERLLEEIAAVAA